VDQNSIFNSRNDQVRRIGIEYLIVGGIRIKVDQNEYSIVGMIGLREWNDISIVK